MQQGKEVEVLDEIEKIKVRLSRNIKYYRKSMKISQQAFADMCGLHRTYISDLENAKCNPTLGVMVVVARALNVDPEKLICEKAGK